MKALNKVIIKPLISEKSLRDAGSGHYSFVVMQNATKRDVAEAVNKLFSVNVKKVYTNIIKKSKTRVTRRGHKRQDLAYKKARVILGKDQKIELFDEATK